MKKFINSLLDLIYRKKCYFCGKSKYSLKMCPNCYEKLEFSNFEANRIINGVDIFCAGVYTKELQKLIRGLKYHKQKDLAYYQAKFMYDYFKNISVLQNKDFVLEICKALKEKYPPFLSMFFIEKHKFSQYVESMHKIA